jgi:RimJ/RimL family protein N-acetyltransferase
VHFPRSREAARRWAEQEAARKPEGDDFRFVIQDETGSAIGSISTHFCDHRNGTFYYGVALLQAARGKGYAREAITLMLRYYFAELRYQKAMAVIYSFNEASIRLHEGLGFQHEGRLRRMGFTEGRYFDHLFYGITAEEFLAGASGSPPAAQ